MCMIDFQGVANFMSKVRGGRVKFDENRVVMSGGATGANEVIMLCLANPGDAFLIPTPYYPAYVYMIHLLFFYHTYISSSFSFNVAFLPTTLITA